MGRVPSSAAGSGPEPLRVRALQRLDTALVLVCSRPTTGLRPDQAGHPATTPAANLMRRSDPDSRCRSALRHRRRESRSRGSCSERAPCAFRRFTAHDGERARNCGLVSGLAEGVGPPAVFAKPLTRWGAGPPLTHGLYHHFGSSCTGRQVVSEAWFAAVLGWDGAGAPSGTGYHAGRSPGRSIRRWRSVPMPWMALH